MIKDIKKYIDGKNEKYLYCLPQYLHAKCLNNK